MKQEEAMMKITTITTTQVWFGLVWFGFMAYQP